MPEDKDGNISEELASLSDVDVVVNGVVFKLHAWVLASQSSFFLKALTSAMQEKTRVVVLQETRVSLCYYGYCGCARCCCCY